MDDGTITARVTGKARMIGAAQRMTLYLPRMQAGATGANMTRAGRYFLARCGAQTELERQEQWSIYFRRPLFIVNGRNVNNQNSNGRSAANTEESGSEWDVTLPLCDAPDADAGYRWLQALPQDAEVNLLGPLGQGFALHPDTRNVLLVADAARVLTLFPLLEEVLNRQGRITLLVRLDRAASSSNNNVDASEAMKTVANSLLAHLPISVEVHFANSEGEWVQQLDETLRWADQLCVAIPQPDYLPLAEAIGRNRFHQQEGFAQVLVEADLACGIGACLACVVSTASGGLTRACVHGPVIDLTRLVR